MGSTRSSSISPECMLALTGILVLLLGNVNCVEEGTVRLEGGSTPAEGTVLIYHAGIWGAVCDDQWDRSDGNVVCRQLGYQAERNTFTGSFHGQGKAWIWMSRLRCTGEENQIDECSFSGWGRSNCNGDQRSAGVRCLVPPTTTPPGPPPP